MNWLKLKKFWRADMRKLIFWITLALMLTACSGLVSRVTKGEEGGTPAPIKKVLGAFYPIAGTQYQLANITTEQGESGRSGSYDFSQLFSYGRSDYSVYNYVFLDVKSESVYALLPTNVSVILSIQGYPAPNANIEPKIPVAWWLYTLVKTDSNEDGQLSYTDQKTLAISDVGGQGYTELISDVDQVLGDVYKDGNVLLLIYRTNGKNFLASIDLASRKVTRNAELPSFGEDVK
jgi:hypothetical protein